MAIMNEFFLLGISGFFFAFVEEINSDVEKQIQIGWALIAYINAICVINMVIQYWNTARDIWLRIRDECKKKVNEVKVGAINTKGETLEGTENSQSRLSESQKKAFLGKQEQSDSGGGKYTAREISKKNEPLDNIIEDIDESQAHNQEEF